MNTRLKLWKMAAALALVLAVTCVHFQLSLSYVKAEQADTAAVVAAAAEILYDNEGSYDSVNANDNGALSIGKLQWHGWRALSLLKKIAAKNEENAKKLLGDALYQEVKETSSTSKWSTRTLNTKEAAAVKKLLAAEESREVQDELAVTDISSYIQQGRRLGIANEPALVYFADLTNQGGSGAAGRVAASASKFAGGYAAVTLNELHQAALCDSVMGKSAYHSRRFGTYVYAAQLGWTYCSSDDSYIPNNYASAKENGAAWIQRSLNTCMKASLTVSGVYDNETKAAVAVFQGTQGLEKDGCAGKDTIAALIKAVFSGKTVTVQNPSASEPEPGNPGASEPGNPSASEPESPLQKTVLTASKKSYAVNDTHSAFTLKVTSSHSSAPIQYAVSDTSVAAVNSSGKVTVKGAGTAVVTASQAETDTYAAAEVKISITVYSTKPADHEVPTGALYAGKNMKKAQVQWLQASLIVLYKADITVNGSWSASLTKLVTDFQAECGIGADGIAGTQTQELIKKLLAVKAKKPALTIKTSSRANTLSWKKYADADRVYIYRKEKGGSYKRIKTITNMAKTSYQDTSAKKGVQYYYVAKYGCVNHKLKTIGLSSNSVSGTVK